MNKELLKIAGKELLQGNIGNAVKSVANSFTIGSGSYYSGENWHFSPDGSADVHFSFSNIDSAIIAYEKCSPLTAIINRKAIADSNGKIWIMKYEGKGKGKEANSEVANKVRALLNKPNPLQSGVQFGMMVKIYTELFGSCLIIPTGVPDGFPMHYAKHLWVVPRSMYRIDESPSMFLDSGKTISQIVLTYKGISRVLNPAQCLLIKGDTPSFVLDNLFIPESKVKALAQDINNVIGALESAGVLIDNRGPSIVISSDQSDQAGTIALTMQEKEEVQKDFQTRYGMRKGQFRSIITNAAIKVQEVGFNFSELGLLETVKKSIEAICDSYVFPHELMANSKGSTFNNGTNGDKVLYQNAIIPEANSIMQQFAEWFELSKHGLTLEKDFSHVAALQANKKEEADATKIMAEGYQVLFRNNVVTLNQWREKMGLDTVAGGDVYYSEIKDSIGDAVINPPTNSNDGQGQQNNGNQA